MEVIHCSNCGKKTGHKRALGWGTFFAVILSFGFWLLAIPFYPKRCIICGTENADPAGNALVVDSFLKPKKWYKTWWGILFIIMGITISGQILSILGLGGGKKEVVQRQQEIKLPISKTEKQPEPKAQEKEVIDSAERGQKLFIDIVKKYPEINLEPIIFGLATPNPYLLLALPEKEWDRLSRKEQINITYYLEMRVLPVARVAPERYINIPPTAPIYRSFYEKAKNLCDDCWGIMIGPIDFKGKGVYIDKTIVLGDSVKSEAGNDVRASKFRKMK